MTRILTGCTLLLALLSAPVLADELKTLTPGKNAAGELEKITDKDITVGGVTTPVPQALLLTLRPGRSVPTAEKYIEVVLSDDSLLRCTKVTYGAKETQLTLTTGAIVKAPSSGLITVLRDAQDARLREQWPKLLKSKERTDRIFLLSDGNLNPIKGALGAIDEANQTIKFQPETKGAPQIEPSLEKLQGLQFARTDSPAETALCKVIDIDGNMLLAAKIAFASGQFTVTTLYGQKVTLDHKLVANVNFNIGRLVYLSDLEARMPPAVLLGGFNPVRKDQNLDGNPIILQDKQFAKGLSMYAGTELEYDLKGQYKKLTALLGVDSRIAEEGQGTVTVSIYCGREKRFSQQVSVKATIPINLDVKDVDTLRIVVSGSNFTNFSGHATLANAHVSQ